jgi:hypothetical protein
MPQPTSGQVVRTFATPGGGTIAAVEPISPEEAVQWMAAARRLKEGLPLAPKEDRARWGDLVIRLFDERHWLLDTVSGGDTWRSWDLRETVVEHLAEALHGVSPWDLGTVDRHRIDKAADFAVQALLDGIAARLADAGYHRHAKDP